MKALVTGPSGGIVLRLPTNIEAAIIETAEDNGGLPPGTLTLLDKDHKLTHLMPEDWGRVLLSREEDE